MLLIPLLAYIMLFVDIDLILDYLIVFTFRIVPFHYRRVMVKRGLMANWVKE